MHWTAFLPVHLVKGDYKISVQIVNFKDLLMTETSDASEKSTSTLTTDETRFYNFDLETQLQSTEWCFEVELKVKRSLKSQQNVTEDEYSNGIPLLCFLVFLPCITETKEENVIKISEEVTRSKRQLYSLPLVYPYGSVIRLILGFSNPVPLEDNLHIIFGVSFLYQYMQFDNITALSQYYSYNTISRDQRSIEWEARRDERLTFYTAVERLLDSKGFNGYECVLRAICEAAQYPVHEEGLFGEILHILLTPNYGRSPFNDADKAWTETMADYINAYTAGRQMFSCSFIYNGCPEGQGLLEIITLLKDE